MRDRRRSLAWRSSVLAASTGVFLVAGSVSAQATPAPNPTPTSPTAATAAQLPHWGGGAAAATSGWTVPGGAAQKVAAAPRGVGSAAAKAAAATRNAAVKAANAPEKVFAPGAVNRTVKGGAPTGSWTPATSPDPSAAGTGTGTGTGTGKRAPAGSTTAPATATPSATTATSGTAAPRTLNAAAPAAVPTGGYPGSPGAGAGMGLQSFYGTEAFGLGASVTATVNLANGNVNLHSTDQAYNAPGLSVNLDSFINNQVYGQGALGGGGVLSTGQDIGLSISGTTAGSTTTFYGPSGFTAVFTAAGTGSTQTWTMPAGINADLVHNSDGTWTLTYRASGEKLSFTAGGYLVKDTDRNNIGLSFSYNAANRLTSITDAVGRVTSLAYNGGGLLASITDPTGRVNSYAYNGDNQLTQITYADATTMNISYDSAYMIAWVQNRDGNWTHFGYDPSTRVTSVDRYLTPGAKTGATASTTFAYNTGSGVSTSTQETSPIGGVTTYALDSIGRVTTVTDPLGRMRAQTWTPNSDLATATDAMGVAGTGTAGNVSTYSYDTLNNRTAVTLPTGAASRAAYTATTGSTGTAYQAKTATDPSGHTRAFTYDGAGNVLSVRDSTATTAGGTGATATTFTYQAATPSATASPTQCGGVAGQVCTATDGNGNVTTYRYDSLGNLTKVTPAAPLGTTTYTYDTAGRVISVTDGKGQKTQYAYDAADRIITTTFNNGETVTNTYDGDGNLTVSTDQTGGSSYYEYDALNRQTWQSQPNMDGSGFGTTYDAASRITSVDDYYGQVTYAYDSANQLTSMTEPSGFHASDTITFAYDRNGAETSRTFPGGLVQTTTRDNAGRPTRITDAVYNGTYLLSDLGYSYTAAGGSGASGDRDLVQSRTDYVGTTAPAGSVTAYGHDGLNRLTSARETTPTAAINASWAYTYDNAGNRTGTTTVGATTVGATASTASAATTWGYNGANEAISRNGSTTGWAYDANGNQTAATWGTGTYDDRDALTAATPTGSSTATTFAYLGAGNGARQITNTINELTGSLGLAATYAPGGAGVAFRHTPDGRFITAGLPDQTNRYYGTDNLGNVTLVATTNNVTATYSYDPYGTPRTASGPEAADNPIRYGQGYTDNTTGLVKLGIRYYDPTQGRFTQQDPTGQDPHYLYAAGCPSSYNDPTGAANALYCAGSIALAVAGVAIPVSKITRIPKFIRAVKGSDKLIESIKNYYGASTRAEKAAFAQDATEEVFGFLLAVGGAITGVDNVLKYC